MIIDHRERELVKELARRKLKYEVKQLLTADIIIKNIAIKRYLALIFSGFSGNNFLSTTSW